VQDHSHRHQAREYPNVLHRGPRAPNCSRGCRVAEARHETVAWFCQWVLLNFINAHKKLFIKSKNLVWSTFFEPIINYDDGNQTVARLFGFISGLVLEGLEFGW